MSTGFDDVPLNRFHLKITALTFGANFSDGYHLGTIGIALAAIAPQMHLGAAWQGLLGASALIGIFAGSIALGWLGDRIGRQLLYLLDFLLIAIASVLQFFVTGPVELFVLRLLIGIGIGADYALGPTLVAEFVPRKHRGGMLASLTVLWTVGYVAAYFLGNYLVNLGPDAWRWLLMTGAVPAVLVLVLRIGTPESPRWLISKGRIDEARAIIAKYIGKGVDIEAIAAEPNENAGGYRELFGRAHLKKTVFGIVFYNCQVIPYFAIYTFLPIMLVKVGFGEDEFFGNALLNLFLLAGGIGGLWLVAKLSRRRLLIWSFVVLTASLGVISLWPDGPIPLIFGLFLIFTFVMSASSNLDQVYPPELFPTELRGSGVGLLNGASRLGSAAGTFLLPIAISGIGFGASMLCLTAILLIGTVTTVAMAPETRDLNLK
ncbi:MFS transporter [Sciscionella sediminilitoris]|uniref:MFS transporter n=1 Tax=Sciscionella sediminilitoris TaxID=1445613 RepID=UPI000A9727A8|nr:MFS transporter [Sciscionella sp. SE31]